MQAFLGKVRGIIKANKQTPAGKLIVQLNPVIRGWANYHRHVVSKRTFARWTTRSFRPCGDGPAEAPQETDPLGER